MKPLRTCRICNTEAHSEADLELFVRDKTSKHGRANCCLPCRRNEYSNYDKEKRSESREYHRQWKSDLKRKYGISVDEYNSLLEKQQNSCAVCETHLSNFNERLAVDHCHSTGKVRGLLCRHCNLMLGNASDQADILRAGASYLEENK